MKRSRILRSRRRIRQLGKKGLEWSRVRRELKVDLERQGITRCEFGFQNCTGSENLSLAHSVKRRMLGKGEERERLIREVAVSCLNCHTKLDVLMSHEEMKEAVLKAIDSRERIERAA